MSKKEKTIKAIKNTNEICKIPISIKIIKIIYKIINIIFKSIVSLMLVSVVILATQTFINKDKIPSIMGVKVLQVVSESMKGTLNINDVIIAKKVDARSLNVGNIIVFKKDGAVITHRITNIVKKYDKLEFETKGDANNTPDKGTVKEENIEGKYICKIQYIGNILKFIKTPIGLTLVVTIPIIIMLLVILKERKATELKAIRREKRLKYDIEYERQENLEKYKKQENSKNSENLESLENSKEIEEIQQERT